MNARQVMNAHRTAANTTDGVPRDTYGLPADYVANTSPATRDDVTGGEYWARRVAAGAIYQFPVYRMALQIAREREAASILDVGCGLGQKLAHVHRQAPAIRITGLDQASAIDYCRRQYTFGEWCVVDLDRPFAADAEYSGDVVICADVIEHVANPDTLLDHLRQYSAPGAAIILSTPARERLRGAGCRTSPNPHHVREWSTAELRQYVKSRGFRVLKQSFAVPVRMGPNRPFANELLASVLGRRTLRYSQICLLAT